jgi:surface polysaccharide O-acyltransferase-like enzyme
MKMRLNDPRTRRTIISLLSLFIAMHIAYNTSLCRFSVTKNPYDLLMWFFMIVGVYSFFAAIFRALDWYNGKSRQP